MSAILFDLGGTYLRCATSCASGALGAVTKIRIDNFLGGHESTFVWEGILTQMSAFIEGNRDSINCKDPIILAFPGPIEDHRRIVNAPTVTGKEMAIPDLRSELITRTGREVYILNDVSAAAWHLSEKLDIDRFMVITVSSGIGSKIFDRNHSSGVFDSQPYAGEIGHLVVDYGADALDCDCGGKGHLGAIASGRGIERSARISAGMNPASFAQSACARVFGATATNLSNEEHLVPAARLLDEWTLNVIRDSTQPLARALNTVCMAAGLQAMIIIGGFPLAIGPVYLEILRSLMSDDCDYAVLCEPLGELVQLGSMDEEACLQGAGAYARRILLESK